ncbi:MAG: PorT family protein [Bacteroidales bacterium]|jgi:hypothetical protein|nr:PorT family protein [Bacteroidales bacterium]
MKYKYLIIIFFSVLSLLSIKVNGQAFKGMLILRGNISQLDGDQVYGYNRFGINTGLGVSAPLNNKRNILMSLEVLYNLLGAKEKGDPFQYDTRLGYISIPILLHFEDKKGGWTFGAGLQYSRLIHFSENWGLSQDTIHWLDRPDMNTVKPFHKDDISVVLDVRFRIWEKLKFNFRYQYSIISIRDKITYTNGFPATSPDFDSWQRNLYNNSLTIGLIYVINERSTKALDRNINPDIY